MYQNAPLAVPSSVSTSSKLKSKSKTTGWPVSGVYCLTCTNRLNPVDASVYCFELHHTPDAPGQLYATFEFGDLKGLMRLCPEKSLTSRSDKSLSLNDFEEACELDEKTRPGTSCKAWLVCIAFPTPLYECNVSHELRDSLFQIVVLPSKQC
jgi:hypothetical protein